MDLPINSADLLTITQHSSILVQLLMMLGVSTLTILLLSRWRVSPIIGYMLAGILIGPSALGVIKDITPLKFVGELGIACLLFIIGLELSWPRLKSMRNLLLGLGSLQFIITTFFLTAALIAWGQSPFIAVLVAGAFTICSTAIVVQLLAEKGEVNTRTGRGVFAVLLLQDLAAIPLIAIATAGEMPTELSAVLHAAGKGVVALALIIFMARLLGKPLLARVARSRNAELFTAFTLLVVIAMGAATEAAGLSLALGAFLAGLLLSGTEYRHKIEADIAPFKGLLLGLFFMTVGMKLDFAVLQSQWQLVLLATAALTAIKIISTFVAAKLTQRSNVAASRLALWLAGAGEFTLVVVAALATSNLLPAKEVQPILAVAILSIILTPFLVQLDKILQQRRLRTVPLPNVNPLPQESDATDAPLLIIGFGRIGEAISQELRSANLKFVAIDADAERVAKAQTRGLPVFYGSGDDLALLRQFKPERKQAAIVVLDNQAAITRSVGLLRQEWPRVPILARAHDPDHARELQEHGANVTVTETMATSLALAEAAIVFAEEGEI